MARYSVAYMAKNGKVWVKSYRFLYKAKRAAAGVSAKTSSFPLKIFKNSVKKTWPEKATYKPSKGFYYKKWLNKYNGY